MRRVGESNGGLISITGRRCLNSPWSRCGMFDPNPRPQSKCADPYPPASSRCKRKMVRGAINHHRNLQSQRLVPNWIQRRLDGLRFSFDAVRVWNQLNLHVWIAQTVRIHWNEVSAGGGEKVLMELASWGLAASLMEFRSTHPCLTVGRDERKV